MRLRPAGRALWGTPYPSLMLGIYVGIGVALITSSTPFFAAARRLAQQPDRSPPSC